MVAHLLPKNPWKLAPVLGFAVSGVFENAPKNAPRGYTQIYEENNSLVSP